MKRLQHTFFFRWFGTEKVFTAFSVLFCLIQLILTAKQREVFPWLHYGMYSQPHSPSSHQPAYLIEMNGEPLPATKLCDATQEVVLSSIAYFDGTNKKWTDAKRQHFENWLAIYLAQATSIPCRHLLVKEVVVNITTNAIVSEDTILNYSSK